MNINFDGEKYTRSILQNERKKKHEKRSGPIDFRTRTRISQASFFL